MSSVTASIFATNTRLSDFSMYMPFSIMRNIPVTAASLAMRCQYPVNLETTLLGNIPVTAASLAMRCYYPATLDTMLTGNIPVTAASLADATATTTPGTPTDIQINPECNRNETGDTNNKQKSSEMENKEQPKKMIKTKETTKDFEDNVKEQKYTIKEVQKMINAIKPKNEEEENYLRSIKTGFNVFLDKCKNYRNKINGQALIIKEREKLISYLQKNSVVLNTESAKIVASRTTRKDITSNIDIIQSMINDNGLLLALTKMTIEKFKIILKAFVAWMNDDKNNAPLFYKAERGYGKPGNRCLLTHEQTLFLTLMHCKDNLKQITFESMFGVDQTTISRSINIGMNALSDIVPGSGNFYDTLCNLEDADELYAILKLGAPEKPTDEQIKTNFRKALRLKAIDALTEYQKSLFETFKDVSRNLERVFLMDGTHVRIRRPQNSKKRKSTFSGKKHQHTFNTNLMTTANGLVVFASKPADGCTHDLTLFKKQRPGGILDKAPSCGAIREKNIAGYLFVDKGYVGIQKELQKLKVMMPVKKKRNSNGLTQEEKDYSKIVSFFRLPVEHAIGRIKQHKLVADTYRGPKEKFERDFKVCAGLANFHHIWSDIKYGNFSIG